MALQGNLVERRLGNVDGPSLMSCTIWRKKRQEQGADVRAVDVGVGHDDDLAVAEFLAVKLLGAMCRPRAWTMVRISSWPSILSMRAFSTFRILPLIGRIAWKARSRPPLAVPPAEAGLRRCTFRWCRGRGCCNPRACRGGRALNQRGFCVSVRGLCGGFAGLAGQQRLLNDALGVAGVFFEPSPEFLVDGRLDKALDFAIVEFDLVWLSNWG